MKLIDKYPSVAYLEKRAKRRIPHFVWEYLVSGTGSEHLIDRNRLAFDQIHMSPPVLQGHFEPNTATRLLGQDFSVPFGAAPVGMSGLIWPNAEKIIAKTAADQSMLYILSQVANETPEDIAAQAKENMWFQLYPPADADIQDKILTRLETIGVKTLVVTVDTPISSQRERQRRAGLSMPPKITPITLWRIAMRPAWAIATLRRGAPRFRTLEPYVDTASMAELSKLLGEVIDGRLDWTYIDQLRQRWRGNLIIKGIMRPADAEQAILRGADAIVVSNHGGRQFDGSPASLTVLPDIAAAIGKKIPIIFDSGVRGGVDIMRAISLGADFCLLGRPFLFAVAALGRRGANHAYTILRQDLENNMVQLGIKTIDDLKNLRC